MDKRRVIQRVILAAGVLVAAWGIYLLLPKTGEVILINAAGESVIKAHLEIDGRKFDFADIPPGAARKITFKIRGATPYLVSVVFHYERTLEPETGYFVSKVSSSHQLIIEHDQVVLETGAN